MPREYSERPRGMPPSRVMLASRSMRRLILSLLACLRAVLFAVAYIFVVMEIGFRRIVHVNVTTNPTLPWVKQQIREVMGGGDQPIEEGPPPPAGEEGPHSRPAHGRDLVRVTEPDRGSYTGTFGSPNRTRTCDLPVDSSACDFRRDPSLVEMGVSCPGRRRGTALPSS